jgi:hypothetical protein
MENKEKFRACVSKVSRVVSRVETPQHNGYMNTRAASSATAIVGADSIWWFTALLRPYARCHFNKLYHYKQKAGRRHGRR